MEENKEPLKNTCNVMGISPIMMQLPYPPEQVRERNQAYAGLLSIDYCGAVSELSAITQYIENESQIADDNCLVAKTLLGIGMAEMMHLQKLMELVVLLGGNIDYVARYRDGKQKMWTPAYLKSGKNIREIILLNIEAERAAIKQYQMHIKMIQDDYINAVLQRIIRDEEYHIMVLQALL